MGAHLVFTTHSMPTLMAETSGPNGGAYVAQHRAVARLVADGVAARTGVHDRRWDLVFQSRSGPPASPGSSRTSVTTSTLLAERERPGAVMVPIGFVSDHLEVVWDLDTEAAERAEALGLPDDARRDACDPADPRFVAMVRELVLERAAGGAGSGLESARAHVGRLSGRLLPEPPR